LPHYGVGRGGGNAALAKTSRWEHCKVNNVRTKVALSSVFLTYIEGGASHMVITIVSRLRYSMGFLILASIISLGSAPSGEAQAQAPHAGNSSTPSAAPDPAAKAAERKKRFEEEENRLENAESAQTESKSEPGKASDYDLSIFPVLVNMLVHETQGFSLFDSAGHNLTSKAEWTLRNSYVADLTTNGVPTISTKDVGTLTVFARVGSRTAQASVTVHPGDTVPIGTIR
jgi:hypothetical protein